MTDPDAQYDLMDFEINFTDITLLEANGQYESVKNIMEKPQKIVGKMYASIPSKYWVIKSTISIRHQLGATAFMCDFYHDGKLVVLNYGPSVKDIYSPDMRCLSYWAQESGWKVPEPKPSMAEEWIDFWRRQWETYIVNSDYFDKKFGERKPFVFGDEDENQDMEDDEDKISKL